MNDECQCEDCQRVRIKTIADEFMAATAADAERTVKRYNAAIDEYESIYARDKRNYQERLAAEQQMADTVAIKSEQDVLNIMGQHAEAVRQLREVQKDNATLTERIEELECQLVCARQRGDINHDMVNRVAYVLRTFYFAELSMSSIQPLVALCLELNPEIVEQKR